jgi:hypothetical protein
MCKMLKLVLILILISLCNCVETRNISSKDSVENHIISKEHLIDINTFFNKIGNMYNLVIADSNNFFKDSIVFKEYLLINGTIFYYRDSLLLSFVETNEDIIIYNQFALFYFTTKRDLFDRIMKHYKTTFGPRWSIFFLDFNIYYPPTYNDCSRYYLTTTNGSLIE